MFLLCREDQREVKKGMRMPAQSARARMLAAKAAAKAAEEDEVPIEIAAADHGAHVLGGYVLRAAEIQADAINPRWRRDKKEEEAEVARIDAEEEAAQLEAEEKEREEKEARRARRKHGRRGRQLTSSRDDPQPMSPLRAMAIAAGRRVVDTVKEQAEKRFGRGRTSTSSSGEQTVESAPSGAPAANAAPEAPVEPEVIDVRDAIKDLNQRLRFSAIIAKMDGEVIVLAVKDLNPVERETTTLMGKLMYSSRHAGITVVRHFVSDDEVVGYVRAIRRKI